MNKKNLVLIIIFILLGIGLFFWVYRGNSDDSREEPVESQPISDDQTIGLETIGKEGLQLPGMEIDTAKKYTATLKTHLGEIVIELFADKTPITVNNFVSLAQKDFYNGTIFHRVVKGFMIQGGDPKGDGTGGPGYQFDDEPFEGEYTRGTVAMANAGPNTNGSQFFIMHQNYDLPKNYVIFGRVTEGLEVVDRIANSPTKLGPSGENSTPLEPVKVESVTITEQ